MNKLASVNYVRKHTEVGSYTGNGTTQEITLNFRPRKISIYDDDNDFIIKHFDGQSKTQGIGRTKNAQSEMHRSIKLVSGGITVTDTGFIVGDNPAINKAGVTYYYEVL